MAKSSLIVPDEKVVAFKEPFTERKLFGRFNKTCVVGRVVKDFTFSHEFGGKKYYTTVVEAKRASSVFDHVPVIVNDIQLEELKKKDLKNRYVEVAGRYRSYRKDKENSAHIEYGLLATNIEFIQPDGCEDTNVICLEGSICKVPVFRRTPTGRVITEFVVKVKKAYQRADLIPCIAWEKIAEYAGTLKVGTNVRVFGRIQSRTHFDKKTNALTEETYEVSIWRIKRL